MNIKPRISAIFLIGVVALSYSLYLPFPNIGLDGVAKFLLLAVGAVYVVEAGTGAMMLYRDTVSFHRAIIWSILAIPVLMIAMTIFENGGNLIAPLSMALLFYPMSLGLPLGVGLLSLPNNRSLKGVSAITIISLFIGSGIHWLTIVQGDSALGLLFAFIFGFLLVDILFALPLVILGKSLHSAIGDMSE